MKQQLTQEQVINLINHGFNIKIISHEFDIPIEKLEHLQQQLNTNSDANKDETKDGNKKEIYKRLIDTYKQKIHELSQMPNINSDELLKSSLLNSKNLLAFAYFECGQIEKSRELLLELINSPSKFNAYRQLIHLEHKEGNIDDAKIYAYDAIDLFPDSIPIRKQLINIAIEENDYPEIREQLQNVLRINPKNTNVKNKLNNLNSEFYR